MSSDNQLNYGLDTDTIDIADSVIIDVATKTLGTIPGIHSLSPRFYDELVVCNTLYQLIVKAWA